jgi:metallophosphoesterase superfamily enzyme
MAAQNRGAPYDGLLLLGDLIHDDGDPARLEAALTRPFAPVLDTGAALLPVLGNHD